MTEDIIRELRAGHETAFVNKSIHSNLAYKPEFISNNFEEGKKVLTTIEDELLSCDEFHISVAFITMGGITPILQTLRELEIKGIKGEILTTNYLNFSEPKALKKLSEFKNIIIRMYDVDAAKEGFHTKGYIFEKEGIYRIIIGSSNITSTALTSNREWNTKIVSTKEGEMAQGILGEFEALWDSEYALEFDTFYERYKEQYRVIKKQREIAKQAKVVSLEQYRLKPNQMQTGFITNLRKLIETQQKRALLISATGTGKTYASAFAMRELGFKRVLFLVHRGQLARQSKKSYERVFGPTVSMGLVGSGYSEYEKDYIFGTIQTLNREYHLNQYRKDDFDCIILDEAHHSSADSYQKIMEYFTPKLWLGMTATPDKREDNLQNKNIYEIFNHNIAYEIRLQQAMEEDMLCPFHYFGISDISMVDDEIQNRKKDNINTFNQLVSDERVRHILEKAEFYGYSGDRVKGLIFCSKIEESKELSKKFNELGYRTIALNGDASESERFDAFERLAMDEDESVVERMSFDYIFSVEILNEGIDIVEVNQVIMLRPTQSPIVFIQQLGRGLRKAEGKEYVVILDFIGNYKNNFMIPVALSGDRTYNPDTIRKYVISGNNSIPGASTIHFDEISKHKIFESIDKIKGMKAIIKESYINLKNRLGRIPYLYDFYSNNEVDPLVIIREYKTYQKFLETVEDIEVLGTMSEQQNITLEYLSKTVLSGIRPYEFEILNQLMENTEEDKILEKVGNELEKKYQYAMNEESLMNALSVLEGNFVTKKSEYDKYKQMEILYVNQDKRIKRLNGYTKGLENIEFRDQIKDIIQVAEGRFVDRYLYNTDKNKPSRYNINNNEAICNIRNRQSEYSVDINFSKGKSEHIKTIIEICEDPVVLNSNRHERIIEYRNRNINESFVLYEKYSRRDVSLLMNIGKDLSSIMYGKYKIGDDVFIFVTYYKMIENDNYIQGKPNYADVFADNSVFRWDAQIGNGENSKYVLDVINAKYKHLFVQKVSTETNFYYMGQFDVVDYVEAKKLDNKGKEKVITKFELRMHHLVREDLLKYLQSSIK